MVLDVICFLLFLIVVIVVCVMMLIIFLINFFDRLWIILMRGGCERFEVWVSGMLVLRLFRSVVKFLLKFYCGIGIVLNCDFIFLVLCSVL